MPRVTSHNRMLVQDLFDLLTNLLVFGKQNTIASHYVPPIDHVAYYVTGHNKAYIELVHHGWSWMVHVSWENPVASFPQ